MGYLSLSRFTEFALPKKKTLQALDFLLLLGNLFSLCVDRFAERQISLILQVQKSISNSRNVVCHLHRNTGEQRALREEVKETFCRFIVLDADLFAHLIPMFLSSTDSANLGLKESFLVFSLLSVFVVSGVCTCLRSVGKLLRKSTNIFVT